MGLFTDWYFHGNIFKQHEERRKLRQLEEDAAATRARRLVYEALIQNTMTNFSTNISDNAANVYPQSSLTMEQINDIAAHIRQILKPLSPFERTEILAEISQDFCFECGRDYHDPDDPVCHCMNDD